MATVRVGAKVMWRGGVVKADVLRAAAEAINETMAESVIEAKQNHPGWKNITGTAEGSVQVLEFASAGKLVGLWGSRNVDYVIWLELKHGSFLRNASDVQYPLLTRRLKNRLLLLGY